MVHVGIPSLCIWGSRPRHMKTFRGIYQFFRFQGNAGVADASTTGFPEDCSMVVIAMTCMAFLAHTVAYNLPR